MLKITLSNGAEFTVDKERWTENGLVGHFIMPDGELTCGECVFFHKNSAKRKSDTPYIVMLVEK
jgi:hypothetical protein